MYAAKVAFWAHQTDTHEQFFVGSGTFVANQWILTAKHLFGMQDPAATHWVRAAVNASASLEILAIERHPTLDVALVQVATCPANVQPMAWDIRSQDQAKADGWELCGFFEGKSETNQALVVTSWDDVEKHFITNCKQPKGQSGGAVCAGQKLWAVSTRHYSDAHTVRGCAVAVHQFEDWMQPLIAGAVAAAVATNVAADPAVHIAVQPGASPACVALAKALGQPSAWASLQRTDFTPALEALLTTLLVSPAMPLSGPQQLYDLCVGPGVSAKRWLYKLKPLLTSLCAGSQNALKEGTGTLRVVVLCLCQVLAERMVRETAIARSPTTQHDVQVPILSEALAVLIAAVWIHGDQGIHLDHGVTAMQGQLVAHGAVNVSNAPSELGYPPAESAATLVRYQLLARQQAYSPAVPWDDTDYFLDSVIPTHKEMLTKKLGKPCDVLLTLNQVQCLSGHLLGTTEARAAIKMELGLWTVVYGATDTSADPVLQLAKALETAFIDIFHHL